MSDRQYIGYARPLIATGYASMLRISAACLLIALTVPVRAADTAPQLQAAIEGIRPKVVEWRRDIHRNPELGNREVRTAKLVAAHLRSLGLEVRTGIAHTGVVGVLRGGRPGPVIALRADMDALPVTEETDLPFKSVATSEFRGEKVGVMHACGHDGHTAILMGAASVLAAMREGLPGTVMFVFQPAEEGPPEGERGGAPLMLEEGLFSEVKPEAMFGLHLRAELNVGQVGYRSGPMMAGSDRFRIVVTGRSTHGGRPWQGVDPIVTASQIVLGLQTIVARQTDITRAPVVVSVGSIKGGVRFNIIPDTVELVGTVRTFDPEMRRETLASIERIATQIAAAAGAAATVEPDSEPNKVVVNDPALTERMLPTLKRIATPDGLVVPPLSTVAEDFSFYSDEVPTLYVFVGSTAVDRDAATAPANHSPMFLIDEKSLDIGLRTLLGLTLDYLQGGAG
jgi:amidohydrolase